jgi:hypothetical protein
MRAALAFILALAYTPTWSPVFNRTYFRVKVGETRTVQAAPLQMGYPERGPWTDWIFRSTRPAIAHVEGEMLRPVAIEIAVTGIAPGEAGIFIESYSRDRTWVTIDVVCGDEELLNATPVVKTLAGRPATLRVETPDADRTAFTWYRGRIDNVSQPIANAGPELVLTPETRGTEYYWVRATTTCSRQSAEFVVEAQAPKQRSARR